MSEPKIAIVGSGPAGCYTAQALRRDWPDAEITVFDQLPVPYGLVRYGIASDHQGTKGITRQFDRLFERENISFAGNVRLGTDIQLQELRDLFDIVVLSTGLSSDRPLDIPGARLPGVAGSGHVTRWLNSCPGDAAWPPVVGNRVVVIGNGNVALDLVRLLSKSAGDFTGTDIHDSVLHHLSHSAVRRVSVVGRSPAADAKFDVAMIKELGKISGLHVRLAGALESSEANNDLQPNPKVSALEELAGRTVLNPRVEVEFAFGWTPVEIEGTNKVNAAVFADESGTLRRIPADSVVTAIGFVGDADNTLELLAPAKEWPTPRPYRLEPGLYCVGWLRRGAQGTIPDNRKDAKAAAACITADLIAGPGQSDKPGLAGVSGFVEDLQVTFADWKRIDAAEVAAAGPERIRSKFLTTRDMVAAATSRRGESETLKGAQR